MLSFLIFCPSLHHYMHAFVDNETKPTVAMMNRKQMDSKIIWTLVASFVKLSEEPSDADQIGRAHV